MLTFTKNKLTVAALAATLSLGTQTVNSQAFSESFNDITTLAGSGWVMTNASVAVGSTNWFQGSPVSASGPFDAFNGATNAYIGANYNNTGNTGTISNWLMTPNRTFRNGDVIKFYTRKPSQDDYADRLEVRMSTNGASTSVGSGTSVGDYTTLLLSVNPTLVLGVYPTVWTQYTITISGLPAPTSGRIAFRYFVTGAGFLGTSSDYIGIDQIDYTPYVCPAFTLTAGGALSGGTAGVAYSTTLTQTGALGAPSFAVTAGALPPGVTLSASGTISGTPTATGTFNFTATASDASGCSGSQSYSITVVCPPNPITFSAFPSLCSNNSPLTLSQASPAGGTYSGTGVSAGSFDPAAGTQSVTYDYTDPYGCAFSSSTPITVNTAPAAPSISASGATSFCDGGSVVLTSSAANNNVWSGSETTQAITVDASGSYSVYFTDGNGCQSPSSVATDVTEFAPVPTPTISASGATTFCDGGSVTLTSSAASDNVWSNNETTQSITVDASGSFSVSFTDGNGCPSAVSTVTEVVENAVVSAPTISSDSPVCAGANVNLSANTITGATYVWTGPGGFTSNSEDPTIEAAEGTYSAYVIVDGCSSSVATTTVVFSPSAIASFTSTNAGYEYTFTSTSQNATSVSWDFGDGGPASTSNVTSHTYTSSGEYTVTLTATNSCGSVTATSQVTIVPFSINESNLFETINVYPNPTDNGVNISISLIETQSLTFKIYDMQGKVLVNEFAGQVTGSFTKWIDLSTLASGSYQLSLETAHGKVVRRIIKK